MGILQRKKVDSSVDALDSPHSSRDHEKVDDYEKAALTEHDHEFGGEADPATGLHRGLRARQVTMIAIGGAIGTGLIIGTGSALAKAGPLSILISYSIVGFIVYMVMCALGEMAAYLPIQSGFTGYAARFCDPALGFSLGYTYWFKCIFPIDRLSIN